MILRLVLGMLLIVIAGTAVSWAAVRVVDGVSDLLDRRKDTYDPRFAETPESDAAFADVQRVFAGQFDADGDLLPRAAPRVAAGSDLDGSGLMFEVYEAMDRYRRGEDIEQDAPREV